MKTEIEFKGFPKMARLSRQCIITEKIDGTNAQILITDDGQMLIGSRTRWITPENDNFGFAKWATDHKDDLLKLGAGSHFGEWWGAGIQRRYDLTERRFSLFNTIRWCPHGAIPARIETDDPRIEKYQDELPACVGLVPVLYRGMFTTDACSTAIERLKTLGSEASTGFMKPEGIVCYHIAAGVGFKKTIEKDEAPKSLA
jgi:hypothetical protein